MRAAELKKGYIDFFIRKGHKLLPNVSLVPENDPSVLFTTAGMHPLVPYLMGETHPLGKRLCSVQRCLRTDDIDNVGDGFHHTFFEMLGNWSLGDYWKEEALTWSLEFLTDFLGIPKEKISVSCFAGDADAPKDEEAAAIWRKLGIPSTRIYFLPKNDNWWGPAGKTGPCGPDSEIFFDTGKKPCGPNCDVTCHCGKYIEIWNNVFMQYEKRVKKGVSNNNGQEVEYEFVSLKQKNVDTGMGVERTVAVTSRLGDDNYQTEIFSPVIQMIEKISKRKYAGEDKRPMRIIADHIRAASFLIADGVIPANVDQGYILRRLIRRAVRYGKPLGITGFFTNKVAEVIVQEYSQDYPRLANSKEAIYQKLQGEEEKFSRTLTRGLKELEKILSHLNKGEKLPGRQAFLLYESFGFPFELTKELASEKDIAVDEKEFRQEQKAHQEKSRAGMEKKFAGGLADHSVEVVKYHTATHLLHAALRKILGTHVRQVGSNLTAERLRFDFIHPERLKEEEIKNVEDLVNEQIRLNLPVKMEMMDLEKAKKEGALAFFEEKYGERVKVYSIGNFSKEVCGGPHVDSTGVLGKLKIIKQEAVGSGRQRIYGKLENHK